MVSPPAVVFDHVTKAFALERSKKGRSFQESVIALFRRRRFSGDSFAALNDVSLSLEQGKTYGFIGANGAGKSTALKLISRIIQPTSGSITVNGQVGALLELGAGFHPDLTGRENVYLNGAVLGLGRDFMREHFDEIVAFSELDEFIDVPVKHYSSGMYVRLGFSVAVHTRPDILLVDEVLAVGDASFQQKCLKRIAEMRRSGVTIILVTHDVTRVQSMCDEVYWFDRGALVSQGESVDVTMAYLHGLADLENLKARRGAASNDGTKAASVTSMVERSSNPTPLGKWGSGRIRITEVELRDRHGRVSASFITGEPFEVRLHYTCDEIVHDPIFGLAIHHQSGSHITGPNTRVGGLDLDSVRGDGIVSYRIEALPLLEGAYELSVSAHEKEDLEMYDYHDRLYSFRVFPGDTLERFGIVSIGGIWTVENQVQHPSAASLEEAGL